MLLLLGMTFGLYGGEIQMMLGCEVILETEEGWRSPLQIPV